MTGELYLISKYWRVRLLSYSASTLKGVGHGHFHIAFFDTNV